VREVTCDGCSGNTDCRSRICAHGFPKGNYPNHDRPACMRDDFPELFMRTSFDESGKPLLKSNSRSQL